MFQHNNHLLFKTDHDVHGFNYLDIDLKSDLTLETSLNFLPDINSKTYLKHD